MIAALEDSPRAREIVRQAFLPCFPIRGAAAGDTHYIPVFTDDMGGLGRSVIYQDATTSFIGVNTSSPIFGIDLNRSVFAIGPKDSSPGNGGTMRFRDDTGNTSGANYRWLFGIPGTSGLTDFHIYNGQNGHEPLFIANGAPSYMVYVDGNGNLGIGISTPLVRLDARAAHAKATTASFENVFEAASTDSLGPLALRAGIKTDSTDTNRYGAIEVDDNGTKRPLALQPSGGGVVIGGTLSKQVSGGPEKLGFQDSTASNVCVANFVGSEACARLLIDMQGNHEWAGSSDVDQNVLLGWLSLGRLQCQGVAEGGFSLHAWKHSRLTNLITSGATSFDVDDSSQFAAGETVRCENELMTIGGVSGPTLTGVTRGVAPSSAASHAAGTFITALGQDEAHARIALSFDGDNGTEIAFSDGTNASDAWLSRPTANQIFLRGNLATQRAGVSLSNGDNNNVALGGTTFAKVTGPTAAFAVTGFAGGSDGRILLLYNSTSQTMTIKNNNASSSAANRILTLTGADVALRASKQSFATFIYDSGQSLWILVSTN